ncbi:MAG: hypothetical protein VX772_02505 [Bacteroidota bacterium]|uniref:Tfp pilus assembly protein, major pilin PilA n=1 Tax=Flagellimonas okinawensis TaxID=3031324 RepID=A0ABT5XJL6_9FLAO|nr:hypothetical protein [[Muricauda] okinawensis]MDF0706074.1 hypothetical protein [[Muricauda] okinawensis]MEC8831204.1 hypothetical protein [Bacteroidota bacterium]
MKIRFFVVVLTILVPFSSCKEKKKENNVLERETFQTVTIDGNYKIEVPKFMTGTTGLNEEASLQFQSLIKEAYLLVIDEPKAGFEEVYRDLGQFDDNLSIIQNYRVARMKLLSRSAEFINKPKATHTIINGLDAETLELDAQVDGVPEEISYFLTFVEGDDRVYMIMAWTLKNKKIAHKKTFKTIAESFQLIN